jgi:voltage-gated potassium channel
VPFFMILMWKRITKHQTLTLTTIAFITTIIGALLFAFTQHVSPFIGFYWAITTITTVGYGDVTPHNTLGRVIAMGTMLTTIPLAGAAFAGWAANMASLHIRRALGMTLDKTRDHLIVLGYSPLLIHLLPDLLQEHQNLVLVSMMDTTHLPPEIPCITGDPTNPHVLAKAHLSQAKQIVVVGETDGEVLMTAVEAQHLAPDVPIFAITQSRRATHTLQDLGILHSVAAQDLLGHTLAKSLETPHAADLFTTILASDQTRLQEMVVPPAWVGQELSAIRSQNAENCLILLGLVHENQIFLGVHQDRVIEMNDRVLFLTAGT